MEDSRSNSQSNSYGGEEDGTKDLSLTSDVNSQINEQHILLFGSRKSPSKIFTIFLAFQVMIVTGINVIWLPRVISPFLCIHADDPAQIEIISLIMFSSGLTTLLFTTFGLKLPILMLPNFHFIQAMINVLKLSEFKCPPPGDLYAMGNENRTLEWQNRFKYLQGGILMATIFQLICGLTGLTRLLDKLLKNKLILIPTTIVFGVSYTKQILNLNYYEADNSNKIDLENQWGEVFLTVGILVISGLKLKDVEFNLPTYTHAKGFGISYFKLFRMFPVIFASFFVLIVYPIVSILLKGKREEETLVLQKAFEYSDSVFLHYPFAYGFPSIDINIFLYFILPTIIQVIQSIIIYRITRFIYGHTSTKNFIRRGIMIESLSSVVAGTFGMTSASSVINVGLMQLTGVGSIGVIQLTAFLLILFSFFIKLLKIVITIPPILILSTQLIISPLILVTGLSMISKLKISKNVTRNFIIIGISLYTAFMIPKNSVNAFSDINMTQILTELVSTDIIVCLSTASLLNYILPGGGKLKFNTSDDELDKEIVYKIECEQPRPTFCEELFATFL